MPSEEEIVRGFQALRDRDAAREKAAAAPTGSPFENLPGYRPPAPPPEKAKARGSIFAPWSTSAEGEFVFPDWSQGLTGTVVRPLQFLQGIAEGRIPQDTRNPAYIGGALDIGMNFGPGSAASRVGKGGVVRPSAQELQTAGAEGFKAYRASGQLYDINDYMAQLQQMADNLNKRGLIDDPSSASKQHKILRDAYEEAKTLPVITSKHLDDLRMQLAGKSPANMQAREDLFNFIERNAAPGDTAVRDAVANYRQGIHSDMLSMPQTAKSRKNISAGLGPELSAKQNRNILADTLTNIDKGQLKGFSPAEQAVMTAAQKGTPALDLAQRGGEALQLRTPAGAGLGLLTGGASTAAGAAMRSYANRGARRNFETADEFIRSQSPLAREQFATAPNTFSASASNTVMPHRYNPVAAALDAWKQERSQLPQTYRVLPDGTVEEFM